MQSHIAINGREIGPGCPAYIVAEMSANHRQRFDEAIRLIRAMKDAGADAVKLQTYTPDTITLDCDTPAFQQPADGLWAGRRLYELYKEAYTPWEWLSPLQTEARAVGLDFFSTPFDSSAVQALEACAVPAYKISSFEVVDLPLIRAVARTGKPLLMSVGMASLDEIAEAVQAVRDEGNDQLVLLKCTSAYPADPAAMNLRMIPALAERFHLPVGLSDHSLAMAIPVTAVTLGACVIEKHFTLQRALGGPDSGFSLEPAEFRAMVDAVRVAEKALGRVTYELTDAEQASRAFRRSLYVTRDMRPGDVFTSENLRSVRPGNGLAPKHYDTLLGRKVIRAVRKGEPAAWDMTTSI
jgi:pseudaminic acid synthase